jgi:excinuclease UvrABC ATPase subunit
MRNNLRVFTKEHRQKISDSRKALYASGEITTWSKGKKMSRDHILKNMKAHLKYDVSLEWLDSFTDIEKLKFLNASIKRKRDYEGFTTEIYKQFIEKFYGDEKFNNLYERWFETKDKWIKPSLDHIQAKANGGTLLLNNLQFVSWLENRAKVDIEQNDWDRIKKNINYYL